MSPFLPFRAFFSITPSPLFCSPEPFSVPRVPFCPAEPFLLSPPEPPIFLSPRAKRGVPRHLRASGGHGWAVAPSRQPRGLIPSASLMSYEGSPLFLCCNLYFSAYNYLKKRAKDIEIIEIKLEKELQEIKALLLQLLKHDEHSEPENEIRSIMKSISDKYKTRESI